MNLKSYGCGAHPEALGIMESSTSKWAWVSGDCCGEWSIEFRTNYKDTDTPECMKLAIAAWNEAPRLRED